MRVQIVDRIADVAADDWNALNVGNDPFLSHQFLAALERNDCVGAAAGWRPRHLLCRHDGERGENGDGGRVLGAMPLYLKDNSFGEFVFDWGWADAYRRHGLSYYPKLVSAIPFTPATGRRLLFAADASRAAVTTALVDAALALAERLGCSSLHWLFLQQDDAASLQRRGDTLARLGCHFHWHNAGYGDFSDFTAALKTKRRKNINRERRLVDDAGVTLRTLRGDAVSEAEWRAFYGFYSNTFYDRGRHPPLSLEFFLDIGAALGERVVLVLASRGGRDLAGAISYRSDDALFGRHWGCAAEFDSLHFECCYYQGIEYCIREGLQRFEPGVQGEHKIWRGFMPTLTRSAHWIAHPGFADAVADFLQRETRSVHAYAAELNTHSPYRRHGVDVCE